MASRDQSCTAGEAKGQAEEKALGAAEATKETAPAGKEKTGGFIQKTGEQVKCIAQGATDAVKNTFGMADKTCDNPNKNTTGKE